MLTDDHLRAIMPALSVGKRTELLPFLQAAMTEFAIDSPPREAAFVAQLAHESGQFRFMEELWGPTDAQRRYEPESTLAAKLGNTEAGDGRRFKGRGPIQITGRANYARYGSLLGVDLLLDPARAAVPDLAFRIAGLFWTKNGLNELADQATADSFRTITKRINGGLNGLKDREHFYALARTALGVADAPVSRGIERSAPGPEAPLEPAFDRGAEAIREHPPLRRTRKAVKRPGKIRTRSAAGATPPSRLPANRKQRATRQQRTTKSKQRTKRKQRVSASRSKSGSAGRRVAPPTSTKRKPVKSRSRARKR
jgi:predicted chitinase